MCCVSGKQQEVLEWLALGKTQREVGEILGISHRTVESHVRGATQKLGVQTAVQALVFCMKAGCIR